MRGSIPNTVINVVPNVPIGGSKTINGIAVGLY
jgi:hypothetical protein